MSRQPQPNDKPSGPRPGKLLQSGIIFSAASFLDAPHSLRLSNHRQPPARRPAGEYGLVLATIAFIGFLGLPLAIADAGGHALHCTFSFQRRRRSGCTGCSPAAANFFFTSPSPARSSPSFSSNRWAIISIFHAHEPHAHRAGLRAGRTLEFLCDGAMPRAWLVQTSRPYRIAGGGLAGFVRRHHDQNLADRRMGRGRLRRHDVVELGFVFLEKGFSAPD